MVVLAISLLLVGAGAFFLRTELRLRSHGHRVLARVASVSHGRRSSSTTLHFNTLPGAAAICTISGARGSVGEPLWIRYLPESPSTCDSDDHRGFMRPGFFILLGTIGIVGSWSLYQRAKNGEPLGPSARRVNRELLALRPRQPRQRRTRRDVSS